MARRRCVSSRQKKKLYDHTVLQLYRERQAKTVRSTSFDWIGFGFLENCAIEQFFRDSAGCDGKNRSYAQSGGSCSKLPSNAKSCGGERWRMFARRIIRDDGKAHLPVARYTFVCRLKNRERPLCRQSLARCNVWNSVSIYIPHSSDHSFTQTTRRRHELREPTETEMRHRGWGQTTQHHSARIARQGRARNAPPSRATGF